MSEMPIHHAVADPEAEARSIDNQKFAMWLYLASEVVIFMTLIAGFVIYRFNEPVHVKEIHEELGLALVTFNTFLLLTSSWAMVMGLRHIQRDDIRGMIRWFGLTALMGTIFVALQYVEYKELAREGVKLYDGGYGNRFYPPTSFHGAHVVVGVFWCLLVMYRARKGRYSSKNYVGVEIFGLYWHFVDVVWIMLFTLLYLI